MNPQALTLRIRDGIDLREEGPRASADATSLLLLLRRLLWAPFLAALRRRRAGPLYGSRELAGGGD